MIWHNMLNINDIVRFVVVLDNVPGCFFVAAIRENLFAELFVSTIFSVKMETWLV